MGTPVSAHPHQQRRRPVPERLVRKRPRDGVTGDALGTALPAPRVVVDDAALQHHPVGLEQLADGFEAELVETAERGEVRGRERRVEHVEVFQDGERENFHPGRPRRLSANQPAVPGYTLNCEEPVKISGASSTGERLP